MTAPSKVIIVGAGGHARVIAGILALEPAVTVIGVADRDATHMGERIGATSIVTTIDDIGDWRRRDANAVALALGDNRERAELFSRLERDGWDIVAARHPTALVESGVKMGRGCVLCARSVIGVESRVGNDVIVNTGAIVDHEARIEDHAHIGPGVVLAGRIGVGSLTFVGAGSTVRDKVQIGRDSVIGCGSVVVSDIPAAVVAYGVPARVRREVA